MNIILVFPGKVWGGAEQYVLDLGTAYRELGHDVTYYYRDCEPLRKRLSGVDNAHILDFKGQYHWSWIKQMQRILEEKQPDVVHVHTKKMVPPLMIAKKLAKSHARILLTYHDAHRNGVPLWFRWTMRGLHRMLFVSDFAYTRWHNSNKWMPAEKCATIINSVKANPTSDGDTLRQRFGIPAGTPILVFSGRVRRSKGCTTIIDALGQLRDLDWHMVFIGSAKPAKYQDVLMAKAQSLGIADRVHFTGFTPNSQAYLTEAYLGLAPSIMLDPCPLSPLEFLQAGRCVITTDSGGQPEYITNGETGIIVKPDAPEQLANAIRQMLTDPQLCRLIGENAREHFIRDLSYPRFVQRILDQYAD